MPPRIAGRAVRALRRMMLPLISMPEANTGRPFGGARSAKIPGPALSTIVLSAIFTDSVGWPRSPARMWTPAPGSRLGNARAPEMTLRSMSSLIAPDAVTTSRRPPERFESRITTRSVMPAPAGWPLPILTSVVGAPSIVT